MREAGEQPHDTESDLAERFFGALVLQATAAPYTPPPVDHPRRWTVAWAAVKNADRWRDTAYTPPRDETVVAEKQYAGMLLQAVIPHEPVGSPLPDAGPEGARMIFGVLASGCAGYRKAPNALDVVEGLRGEHPTERQRWAIETFLGEARREHIHEAWLAGEYTLSDLMRYLDRYHDHTWHESFGIIRDLGVWTRLHYR